MLAIIGPLTDGAFILHAEMLNDQRRAKRKGRSRTGSHALDKGRTCFFNNEILSFCSTK